MKKVIEYQNENEVVIHQSIARLRGVLTPVQSRSMLSILKRANEQVSIDADIKDFIIPTDMFLEDIQNKDTSGVVVKKIYQHLRKLMAQTFVWGTEEEINECIFMQQIKVTNTEVTFRFSDYIREHIKPISSALIIKDFALIQSFRSEYARQLYKHLMMWEQKQALYLSLKDFKDFLGVPKTKSYEQMTNLKTKVLNVAMAEINEKCPYMDLQYTNRTLPRSKTIEGFNFAWRANNKTVVSTTPPNIQIEALAGLYGFKDRDFYNGFTDGSFDLIRKDGTKIHCKSMKQFEWMLNNGKLNYTEALPDMELSKELEQYIGKKIVHNGFNWVILAISQKGNEYSISAHEEDDKDYLKMFDTTIAQLKSAK